MIAMSPSVVCGVSKNIGTVGKRISVCGMKVREQNALGKQANFDILLQFMEIVHTLQRASLFFFPFALIFLTLSV